MVDGGCRSSTPWPVARSSARAVTSSSWPRGPVTFASARPFGGFWFESVIRDAEAWYGFYHNERSAWCARVRARCGRGSAPPDRRITAAPGSTSDRSSRLRSRCHPVPDQQLLLRRRRRRLLGGARPGSQFRLLLLHAVHRRPGDGRACRWRAWRGPIAMRPRTRGRVERRRWLPPALIEGEPTPPGADDQSALDAAPPPRPFRRMAVPAGVADDGRRRSLGQRQRLGQRLLGPVDPLEHPPESYVMLLNKADSNEWKQGGDYVVVQSPHRRSRRLVGARAIVEGGNWYPQVMGFTDGLGTDTVAGPVGAVLHVGTIRLHDRLRPPVTSTRTCKLSLRCRRPLPPCTTPSSRGASAASPSSWPWRSSRCAGAGVGQPRGPAVGCGVDGNDCRRGGVGPAGAVDWCRHRWPCSSPRCSPWPSRSVSVGSARGWPTRCRW